MIVNYVINAIIEFFRSGRVFLATDLDGVVRAGSNSTIRISATGKDFGVEPNREFMARTFLANWTLHYGLSIFLTFTLSF